MATGVLLMKATRQRYDLGGLFLACRRSRPVLVLVIHERLATMPAGGPGVMAMGHGVVVGVLQPAILVKLAGDFEDATAATQRQVDSAGDRQILVTFRALPQGPPVVVDVVIGVAHVLLSSVVFRGLALLLVLVRSFS